MKGQNGVCEEVVVVHRWMVGQVSWLDDGWVGWWMSDWDNMVKKELSFLKRISDENRSDGSQYKERESNITVSIQKFSYRKI